jgi:hypothetical protein
LPVATGQRGDGLMIIRKTNSPCQEVSAGIPGFFSFPWGRAILKNGSTQYIESRKPMQEEKAISREIREKKSARRQSLNMKEQRTPSCRSSAGSPLPGEGSRPGRRPAPR